MSRLHLAPHQTPSRIHSVYAQKNNCKFQYEYGIRSLVHDEIVGVPRHMVGVSRQIVEAPRHIDIVGVPIAGSRWQGTSYDPSLHPNKNTFSLPFKLKLLYTVNFLLPPINNENYHIN